VVASNGISWLGWSEVEAVPPQDLDLYPLKLTHIYFELPFGRDDIGVLIIDKLQAFYPVNEDSKGNNQPIYDFYVVKPGDTVTDISRQIYGTVAYKNEIMANNSLSAGDMLTVGKILVLVRR
jgi:type IV pilus assembly protein PilO